MEPSQFCPPPGVNDAAPVVAHPAASGQGVGSHLTIDRNALGSLWVPSARKELAAVVEIDLMCSKAYGKPRYQALHLARCALWREAKESLRVVMARGGLLHLVP